MRGRAHGAFSRVTTLSATSGGPGGARVRRRPGFILPAVRASWPGSAPGAKRHRADFGGACNATGLIAVFQSVINDALNNGGHLPSDAVPRLTAVLKGQIH